MNPSPPTVMLSNLLNMTEILAMFSMERRKHNTFHSRVQASLLFSHVVFEKKNQDFCVYSNDVRLKNKVVTVPMVTNTQNLLATFFCNVSRFAVLMPRWSFPETAGPKDCNQEASSVPKHQLWSNQTNKTLLSPTILLQKGREGWNHPKTIWPCKM